MCSNFDTASSVRNPVKDSPNTFTKSNKIQKNVNKNLSKPEKYLCLKFVYLELRNSDKTINKSFYTCPLNHS